VPIHCPQYDIRAYPLSHHASPGSLSSNKPPNDQFTSLALHNSLSARHTCEISFNKETSHTSTRCLVSLRPQTRKRSAISEQLGSNSPFIHLFIYSFIYLFIYLFSYLFIYLFTCMCIYLLIYLFIYLLLYLFIHLFI